MIVSRKAPPAQRSFEVRVECYLECRPGFEALATDHINGRAVHFVETFTTRVRVAQALPMQRALYLARRKGRERAIKVLRRRFDAHIFTKDTEAFLVYDPNDRAR